MDGVSTTVHLQYADIQLQAQADELDGILERYIERGIQVLSLDCFDTILWRKTAAPVDVFFDLSWKPTFRKLQFGSLMRAEAEQMARQNKWAMLDHSEVTLRDIYLAYFPDLSEEEITNLTAEEIEAEQEACYAFPPLVQLIRKAHTCGLKIIIVSDTYFKNKELRSLLAHCLPEDVLPMISAIFCSSEYDKSKRVGLLKLVSTLVGINPEMMFHIGDNETSDLIGAKRAGMHALHLLQCNQDIQKSLRMQALAAGILDSRIRNQRSLSSPFKGVFATSGPSSMPGYDIGYVGLGPILYGFGRFLCDELTQLQQAGKRPKLFFIMRDGYLPSFVTNVLAGETTGSRVKISRFVATAASFRTKEDILAFLNKTIISDRFIDRCKQLLIPLEVAHAICSEIVEDPDPLHAFIKQVLMEPIVESIIEASRQYRVRFLNYLVKTTGVEAGDTVVFVDLGYTGTAQNKLTSVLRDELGVNVVGRYLIALPTRGDNQTRKGLLDVSWCNHRMLLMFVNYIALLEQLCTTNEPSVVDYSKNGEPIYKEDTILFSDDQQQKLSQVQFHCLRFVREADIFFKSANKHISIENLRDVAMAELGRMLFIPTRSELNYLKAFQFDLNLGTEDILDVFDEEKGLVGLRKRGPRYMERAIATMRTNYPAELRSAGLELVLSLMVKELYFANYGSPELDLRVGDLNLRREKISIIALCYDVVQNTIEHESVVIQEAIYTYDGYYAIHIPLETNKWTVGIQFGLHYRWVQIESAELINLSLLHTDKESMKTMDASRFLSLENMIHHGDGLYDCKEKTGMLIYTPTEQGKQDIVLRVVFRPVVAQKNAVEPQSI